MAVAMIGRRQQTQTADGTAASKEADPRHVASIALKTLYAMDHLKPQTLQL